MKKFVLNWLVASMIFAALPGLPAKADEVVVAVATNFLLPARKIAADFEESTGHSVVLVAGATGKLATQILAGAPFDVFLAADQARPELLVERQVAVPGSRFTYAAGALVLWSRDSLPLTGTGVQTLDTLQVSRLAMANPKLAPYGLAAQQALDRLGFLTGLSGRIVYGENIGQTFAMAASGNVTVGLVAKSQVSGLPDDQQGHWIDIPETLHEPILQDAVLIMRADGNAAARMFMDFLKSDKVAGIVNRFGYGAGRP